ncbi:hypothetical protein LSAT2_006173 [Lamellibrachia satsuma]|nr:hypothetical protein LSAT2_006173 [Lamellibrachia satsuma]
MGICSAWGIAAGVTLIFATASITHAQDAAGWGAWSECSKTCGGGTTRRNYYCDPTNSGGDLIICSSQAGACNDMSCDMFSFHCPHHRPSPFPLSLALIPHSPPSHAKSLFTQSSHLSIGLPLTTLRTKSVCLAF